MIYPLYGVGVGLCAVLSYLNILANDFALDDFGLLNEAVRQGRWNFLATSDYWAGFEGLRSGLYRPLTTLLLAGEFRLWGENPVLFHASNIVVHTANSVLVYMLVLRLGGKTVGGLAGILFAVHPIHTEAVASLGGRADLLASLGVLTALWLGLRARARGGWSRSAVLALGFGLLAKEGAVVLPGLIICIDWYLHKIKRLACWPWQEYALYGLVIGLWLAVRWQILGGLTIPDISRLDNPLAELAAPLRMVNAGEIALRYLWLLVLPYRLSADYSHAALPVSDEIFSRALFISVGLVLELACLLRYYIRQPGLGSLGALWILVSFSLVSNVVMPIGTIMAERLIYLPSVGFCLLAAVLLERMLNLGQRRLCLFICAMIALSFMGRTWDRNADWRNSEALFNSAIAAYPRSAKAHQGLGEALMKRGDWIGALDEYDRALALYPRYVAAHYNTGQCYWSLEQYARAIEAYRRVVQLVPGHAKAWLNMGAAHYALGSLEKAVGAYQQALSVQPDFAEAWENLGNAYREMGTQDQAITAFRELSKRWPEHSRREEYEAWIEGL